MCRLPVHDDGAISRPTHQRPLGDTPENRETMRIREYASLPASPTEDVRNTLEAIHQFISCQPDNAGFRPMQRMASIARVQGPTCHAGYVTLILRRRTMPEEAARVDAIFAAPGAPFSPVPTGAPWKIAQAAWTALGGFAGLGASNDLAPFDIGITATRFMGTEALLGVFGVDDVTRRSTVAAAINTLVGEEGRRELSAELEDKLGAPTVARILELNATGMEDIRNHARELSAKRGLPVWHGRDSTTKRLYLVRIAYMSEIGNSSYMDMPVVAE